MTRKSNKTGKRPLSPEEELADTKDIELHQIKTKEQVEHLFHYLADSVRRSALLRKAGLL